MKNKGSKKGPIPDPLGPPKVTPWPCSGSLRIPFPYAHLLFSPLFGAPDELLPASPIIFCLSFKGSG